MSKEGNQASGLHGKPSTKHPGTAPGEYYFPPNSATKFEFNDHLRSFTCKIAGKPRPQYRNFATTNKAQGKVKMFSPSKTNQNSFREAFQEALMQAPAGIFRCNGNPCAITVKFYFPRPKHHFMVRPAGEPWPLKSNAPKFVTHAPDIDNCVKLVSNSLQQSSMITPSKSTKRAPFMLVQH